jgi:hypothetical protein
VLEDRRELCGLSFSGDHSPVILLWASRSKSFNALEGARAAKGETTSAGGGGGDG